MSTQLITETTTHPELFRKDAGGWHPVRWIKEHLSPAPPGAEPAGPAVETDAPRAVRAYIPTFTLRQGKDAFVIKAKLTAVKPFDLEIEARRGWMTIRGKRSDDCQLDVRTFDHSYVLPAEIDRESIRASYKRGQLTVVLQVPASWKTRRIPVLAAGEAAASS